MLSRYSQFTSQLRMKVLTAWWYAPFFLLVVSTAAHVHGAAQNKCIAQ